MHEAELDAEARRILRLCNACRYCEGLCPVFPALERQRAFSDGDLDHLANLCHACGACHYACPFAPPHEFAVHVPKTLAALRWRSWRRHACPAPLGRWFERRAAWIGWVSAAAVTLFLLLLAAMRDPGQIFAVHSGPGAFYALFPHGFLIAVFGLAFLWPVVALGVAATRFWRAIAAGMPRPVAADWREALRAAATLRHLDGGGAGCAGSEDRPARTRRLWHHLTLYGFLLCFLATSVATVWHYGLGRIAPYPWWDLPVVLGTLGGLGLVAGPLGLLHARRRRDPELADSPRPDADDAFAGLLAAVAATGLLLLVLRSTPLMGLLLAVHLGLVFAFFLVLPATRFVHAPFRLLALLRDAVETRLETAVAPAATAAPEGDPA